MDRSRHTCVSGRPYRYNGKRMISVVAMSAVGILWAGMVGYVLQRLWAHFLSGQLDWSLWQLVLFHFPLIVPLLALVAGGAQCTAVCWDEQGMYIRTWYWCWFFVPWQSVIDFRPFADETIEESAIISLQRGLTYIHRGLPVKNRQGWCWPRGFVLYSDSKGYADLVKEMKMRLETETHA